MKERPKVITANRHYSEEPFEFGDRTSHWSVWVQGWADEPGGANLLDVDELFSTKRAALKWCRDTYPGVPVLYMSEMTRTRAAAPIDYSADDGSCNRDADCITPDPAGDAPDDGRPVDELATAKAYVLIMRRLYGLGSAQEARAWNVWANMVNYASGMVHYMGKGIIALS